VTTVCIDTKYGSPTRARLVPADQLGPMSFTADFDGVMEDGTIIDRRVLQWQITAMTPIHGQHEIVWLDRWSDVDPANVKTFPVMALGLTVRGVILPVAGPLTDPYTADSGEWAMRQVGTERLYGRGGNTYPDLTAWLAYVVRLREGHGAADGEAAA
jgi:hypothetical protein